MRRWQRVPFDCYPPSTQDVEPPIVWNTKPTVGDEWQVEANCQTFLMLPLNVRRVAGAIAADMSLVRVRDYIAKMPVRTVDSGGTVTLRGVDISRIDAAWNWIADAEEFVNLVIYYPKHKQMRNEKQRFLARIRQEHPYGTAVAGHWHHSDPEKYEDPSFAGAILASFSLWQAAEGSLRGSDDKQQVLAALWALSAYSNIYYVQGYGQRYISSMYGRPVYKAEAEWVAGDLNKVTTLWWAEVMNVLPFEGATLRKGFK